VFFGGMTLYFHNPIFVKWKPTIVFWIFSAAILFTQLFTHKPLMQRMMEGALDNAVKIPARAWKRVNLLWASFFVIMGWVNLYVAYNYSNDIWVNFKFYGISSALVLVSIIQAFYLLRFMGDKQGT
jgi:intracellular septation protein